VIAISGFVVASHESNISRVEFVFGLAAVVAAYIAAFIDRSVAQHTIDNQTSSDTLLNEFIMASGFNRKDAEYVLKTNREFAEETVARSKVKE
jgi:hypothetical protein